MTGDGKVRGPSGPPPQIQSYDAPQSDNTPVIKPGLAKIIRILDETKIDPDVSYNSPYLNQPEDDLNLLEVDPPKVDLDEPNVDLNHSEVDEPEGSGYFDDLDDFDDFDGPDDDNLVVGGKKFLKGDDKDWIHSDLGDWFAKKEPDLYRNLDFRVSDEEAEKLGKRAGYGLIPAKNDEEAKKLGNLVGYGQDKAVDRDNEIKADIEPVKADIEPIDEDVPFMPSDDQPPRPLEPNVRDADSVQILPGVRISKLDDLLSLSEEQRNQFFDRLSDDKADHIRYTLGYLARRPAFEQKCLGILREKRSWLRRLKFWKSSPHFEISDIPQPMSPVRVERLNQVMKKVQLGRSKFIWPKTAMTQKQWQEYQLQGDRRVAALAAENPDEFCRVFDMRKNITPYAVAEGRKYGPPLFRHRAYAILYGMASRGASMTALQLAKEKMIRMRMRSYPYEFEELCNSIVALTNKDPELFSLAIGRHLNVALEGKRDLFAAAKEMQGNYVRAYGGSAADAVHADRDVGHGKILTDQFGIHEKEVGYVLMHVNKMLPRPPAQRAHVEAKVEVPGSDNLDVKPRDEQRMDERGGVIPAGADNKPDDWDNHSVKDDVKDDIKDDIKEDIVNTDDVDDKSPPPDPKEVADPRSQAVRQRGDVGGQGDKYRMRMKDVLALPGFRYRSEMYGFFCLPRGEYIHEPRRDLIQAILYTIGTENPEAIVDEDPQKDREKASVLRELTDNLCSLGATRLLTVVRVLGRHTHEPREALSMAAAVVEMTRYGDADAIDDRDRAEAKAKYEAMTVQDFRNLRVSDRDEYHRMVRLAPYCGWRLKRDGDED